MRKLISMFFLIAVTLLIVVVGFQATAEAVDMRCSAYCGGGCSTDMCQCDNNPSAWTSCWDWNCGGRKFCIAP